MKTFIQTAEEAQKNRRWFVVDASDKVLGRLASRIAPVLRGKNKASFSANSDGGDFVVVINAEKIRLTGKKIEQKKYYHHTGYIGGIKEIRADKLLEKKAQEVLRLAVKTMLPKNSLGRKQLKKLKIYCGAKHPHEAQQPEALPL